MHVRNRSVKHTGEANTGKKCPMDIDRDDVSKTLNELVELELAGAVRYTQYSLMVFGHARIPIMGWMHEQALEALTQASIIGEEVSALGGRVSLGIGELVG